MCSPPARPSRATFGMVSSTHWLASQSAMRDARARRQRLRRRSRRRLRPPRGRAAPQRARRRGAAIIADRGRPGASGALRPGPRPRRAPPSSTTPRSASSWSPAPARLAAAVPGAVRRLAAAAARPRHLVARARCWSRPSATPSTATPLSSGSATTVETVARAVRDRLAHLRRRSGCPAAAHPRPARCSRNPASPPPAGGWSTRRRAAGGDREQQIDGGPPTSGARASSPRRSTRSRRHGRPAMDSSGEPHAGLLTGDDLAGWSATCEEPVTYRLARLHGRKTGRGARARRSCSSSPCSTRATTWRRWTRSDGATGVHAVTEAPSSPSPTARPGTATGGADVAADDPAVRRLQRRARAR